MAADDAELTELLRAALAPAAVEPPADGLLALQRAVEDLRTAGGGKRPAWWRQPWAAGAAAIVTVLGGSSAAFAAGAPMPGPVRSLAHDIGLPVTAPDVYALHNYEAQLARTLQHPNPDPKATAQAARQVSDQLRRLSPDERRAQGSGASQLLERAQHVMADGHRPGHEGSDNAATSTTTGTAPSRGVGDDHGAPTGATTPSTDGPGTTTGGGAGAQPGDQPGSPSGNGDQHPGSGDGPGGPAPGEGSRPGSGSAPTTSARGDGQNQRSPWSRHRWFNPASRSRPRVSLGPLGTPGPLPTDQQA